MSRAKINYGRASIKSICDVESITTSNNVDLVGVVKSLVDEVKSLREQLASLKLSDLKDVDTENSKEMSLLSYDESQKCWIAVESEV